MAERRRPRRTGKPQSGTRPAGRPAPSSKESKASQASSEPPSREPAAPAKGAASRGAAARSGRRAQPRSKPAAAPAAGSKKRSPLPLVLGGAGVVVVIVVLAIVLGGGDPEKKGKKKETPNKLANLRDKVQSGEDPGTAAAKKPEKAAPKKAKPAKKKSPSGDAKYLRSSGYKRLLKAAKADDASEEDLFELAYYLNERRDPRAKKEAKQWAEQVVARNPLHVDAQEILGRLEFLGDFVSADEKKKRESDPWYQEAVKTRERKFLQDQALRDMGLVYHASLPWVIGKERNDDKPLRDKKELDELGIILSATYHRFLELFQKRFRLKPFDGSNGKAQAIPVFWFDSGKSFRHAFRRIRGLKRDVTNAAAFYAPGKPEELMERMIFGYHSRRGGGDREFDNNKLAHEATHALVDFYKRPLGKFEDPESSAWWFSEGLAEFIGNLRLVRSKDTEKGYVVKFEEDRLPAERKMLGVSARRLPWSARVEVEEGQHGQRAGAKIVEGEDRNYPFTLRDLIDLRHGEDLKTRAWAIANTMTENRGSVTSLSSLIHSTAYFQAWTLVRFMWKSGGEYREALMRCFDARRNHKKHDAVTSVTFKGIDLDKLEKEWLASIDEVLNG